jgi:ribosome-binding factor A
MARPSNDPASRPIRLQRIGEQVRHALAEVLARGELRDDLLQSVIVNVSEVRVTPDLHHATVFVKALGGGDDMAVVKALASHARFLRGEVARRLATKYTPDLKFRPDESFDAGARIDAVLRRPDIARDLGQDRPWKSLADTLDDED